MPGVRIRFRTQRILQSGLRPLETEGMATMRHCKTRIGGLQSSEGRMVGV